MVSIHVAVFELRTLEAKSLSSAHGKKWEQRAQERFGKGVVAALTLDFAHEGVGALTSEMNL